MGRRSLLASRPSLNACLVSGLGIALSFAASARADEPAVVRVVVPGCDANAFDTDAFARSIALELRADGVSKVDVVAERGPAAPATWVATISLEASPCSEQARDIDVVIVDELTLKTVERRLSVDDLARGARARVLALAAAELLRASWSELRLADTPRGTLPVPPSVHLAVMADDAARVPTAPPTPAAPVPPSPSTTPDEASRAAPFVRADVALESRFFPAYGTALVGPGVAVSLGAAARVPLRLQLGARALFGTSYDPLGSVAVHLVTGGAAVVLAHQAGPVDVEVGPHLEVGWAQAAGSAATAGTTTGSGSAAVVDASVMLALRVTLGGPYWASIAGDAGEVIRGLNAEASGRRAAGVGGPVAGVAIGLGRSF
jgi:hypothetical protein